MAHAVRNGRAKRARVEEEQTYADGDVLDVRVDCGRSTPRDTPAGTPRWWPSAAVLFAGDALATVSFRTGRTGPQVVAFNEDAEWATDSLSELEALSVRVVVWWARHTVRGHAEAVERARSSS